MHQHFLFNVSNLRSILISFPFFLLSINLSSQIIGTVLDKSTGYPIQYASVFVKGRDKGVTTDVNGFFNLDKADQNVTLTVSAIGYETQEIEIKEKEHSQIKLVQRVYELPEINVIPKKNNKKITIDPLKKVKSKIFTSPAGAYPWILTKFFEYRPEYAKTHFIKQIQIMTLSRADSATINFRLISVGSKGEPVKDILEKNLITTVKKGETLTSIDLEDYNISFPEQGFYVAFEWLIVDRNKSQNSQQRSFYNPMLGIVPDNKKNDIWMYSKGGWYKSKIYCDPAQTVVGQIAIGLTLTD